MIRAARGLRRVYRNQIGIAFQTSSKCGLDLIYVASFFSSSSLQNRSICAKKNKKYLSSQYEQVGSCDLHNNEPRARAIRANRFVAHTSGLRELVALSFLYFESVK